MSLNRVALRFFLHTLVLLILYALVSLIAALKFLPGDLTQTSLPFNQVSAFAAALLDLAVLGGLLGGGIYAAVQSGVPPDASQRSGSSRSLNAAVWIYGLLSILTVVAGLLALLIALAVPLALLKIAVILLVLAELAPALRPASAVLVVWAIGLLLSAVCTLLGLFSPDDFVLASILHALASGVNTHVAHLLAAVALAFWLMPRFSHVTPALADASLWTVAGLLALAGALVAVTNLGLDLGMLRPLAAVVVPLLYLIFAAHSYRAFAARNTTATLAAHWTALGILLLLGGGLLASPQIAARAWVAGTRLSDLRAALALLALVAILLGVINQAGAEMRRENRRVTGLAPFWVVTFGTLGGGLALAGAGLVQVYLERVLSVGYLDTQALLAPLYGLWVGGQGLSALGVVIYALVFWLRRPRP